jgi:hypothetical protein
MKVRDIVMREDAKITKSDGSGVEITADDGVKTTLPADKAAAIMPDPEKPGEYDFNPQAVAQAASGGQPTGPKVGSNVEIKTAEDAAEDPNDTPQQIMDKAFASNPELKTVIVVDAEGDIDFSESFAKGIETIANVMGELVKIFENIVAEGDKWMASPAFATECEEPEKFAQDMQELKASLAKTKAEMPKLQQDIKQGVADIRSIPKDQAKAAFGKVKGPEVTRIQELAGVQAAPASTPTAAPAAAPQVDPKNWKVPSIDFLKKNYQHPADVIDGASPSTTDPERIGAWPPDSDFADLLMALDASYYQARQADPNFQQPGFVKDDWELVQRLLSTPEGKEYAIANWIGLADVNDKSAEAEFNRAQHKEFEKQRNDRDMARPDGVYTPGWKYDQKLGTTQVQADLQKQKQAQAAPQVAKESSELSALLKIAGIR